MSKLKAGGPADCVSGVFLTKQKSWYLNLTAPELMPIPEFYICFFLESRVALNPWVYHHFTTKIAVVGISTIFRIVALELWFAGQIPQEPAKEEEGGG